MNARGILWIPENPGSERFLRAWLNFMGLNHDTRGTPQYFHGNDQAHCVPAPLQNSLDAPQRPANYPYTFSFTDKRRRLEGNRVIHCAANRCNFIVINRRRSFSSANDRMNTRSRKQAYLPLHAALNEYITGKNGERDLLLTVAPLADFLVSWA